MFVQLFYGDVLMGPETSSSVSRVLVHALFLSCSLLLTYCLTSVRCNWQRRQSGHQGSPTKSTKPLFSIPIISDTFSLLLDTERFLRRLQVSTQDHVVPLSLPGRQLSIAMPGEATRTLFRNSRDYVPVPSLFDALTVYFGLTPLDFAVFDHNHISAFEARENVGHVTKHWDPSRRLIEHQRRDFAMFLNGESLRVIMDRFYSNFQGELRRRLAGTQGQDATQLPDLYGFVRDTIFRAEVEALYGQHIFTVCPSLCEDFWAFYNAFPVISRNLPRWLFPSQYQKRDRMLTNFQNWRAWCHGAFDWTDEELVNAEYEPVWGTRYVRRMVQRHEELGFTDAGISSAMLGYLFVTTANTVPAAAWIILHAFLDESLTRRLRHELSIDKHDTPPSLDLIRLGSAPLLNSVYREALRLHVAGATGRTRPGSPQTMTLNWLAGLDKTFWNEGRTIGGVQEHPVESFWAERFLEYPDDPASGPIRKPILDGLPASKSVPKTVHDDSNAKLINGGLQGHWFPFGGGAWRCPGETLARNTMLVSVFVLLRDFEIEVINPTEGARIVSTHRHRSLPFGTHEFDGRLPVRVRKRTTAAGKET